MKSAFQPLYLKAEDVPKLPRGWRAAQVGEITDLLRPGKLYDENSVLEEGDTPVVNQSMDSWHGFHNEEPGVIASEEQPVSTFANHTCAMRLMKRPFSCIQNIFPRVGKSGLCDTVFFHYATIGRVSLSGYKGHHPIYRAAWIPLPPLPQQVEIGQLISAYGDLIENNRRRMALLEEAARQLYRQWFTRLCFPGHEHIRITNGVPEGWRPRLLDDLCVEIRETVKPEYLEPDTPYIGLEHMPRRSISLCEWSAVEDVTSSKHRFRDGDILFGKIRPYFHKVGMTFLDGVSSSDAIVIRPVDLKVWCFVLMTVSSDPFVAMTAQTMREGSKMPRADWKQMQAYPTPLPTDGILGSFERTIRPVVEQLKSLTFANQKLRAARDLLLPRLMSGEIAV